MLAGRQTGRRKACRLTVEMQKAGRQIKCRRKAGRQTGLKACKQADRQICILSWS